MINDSTKNYSLKKKRIKYIKRDMRRYSLLCIIIDTIFSISINIILKIFVCF